MECRIATAELPPASAAPGCSPSSPPHPALHSSPRRLATSARPGLRRHHDLLPRSTQPPPLPRPSSRATIGRHWAISDPKTAATIVAFKLLFQASIRNVPGLFLRHIRARRRSEAGHDGFVGRRDGAPEQERRGQRDGAAGRGDGVAMASWAGGPVGRCFRCAR